MASIGYEGSGRGRRQPRDGQQRGRGGYRRSNESGFRGNDRRSQGRDDYNNNLSKNVRQLCETPIDKSTKVQKYPKGKDGTPIELIANQFCLIMGLSIFYHYDLEIKMASIGDNGRSGAGFGEKKMRRLAQKENREVVQKLANEWTEVFGNKVYVFDGQKNIYTGEKLFISEGQKLSRKVIIEFDGFREQTYEVLIQFTNTVNMSLLNDFYEGRLRNTKFDDFQQVLQVLEIILRYIPSKTRIPVGKSLYSKDNHKPIGDNAVMAFGHYQSVNITEVGLTLVVDRSATLLRSTGPLIQLIANIIGIKTINDLKHTVIDGYYKSIINRQISGLKIFTTHVRNKMRIDTIDSLSGETANKHEFEMDKHDGSAKEWITVGNYFKDVYDINLSFGNFPILLLKGGKNRFLPIELCNVCPEQPMPKGLITPNMTREIVSASNSQKPIQRFGFIQESAETIANESRDLLNAFQLKVIEKPIKLNARKLNLPQVEGNDRKVKESLNLKDWVFINISPKVKDQMLIAKAFVDEMTKYGQNMGINIQRPIVQNGVCNDAKTVDLIYKRALSLCPKLQLIVFCISSNSNPDDNDFDDQNDEEQDEQDSKDNIYNNIKYYGDIEYGIITQCINADRVLDPPRGYFNNFLLKINSKLNGKNVIISPNSRLPIMNKRVMMVGVDVTHPGSNPSGNDSRIVSSVAAVVGSYDKDFVKYQASIRVQPQNKKEIVEHFDDMITELLVQFKTTNNCPPSSIVVFRDGVSEGQFSQVMDHEYKLLLKACHKLMPNYEPKVTVIVVAKRHQTRFITVMEEVDGRTGKPILNIPAGTVVDNTIINPMNNEFYLCSHKGMLGTSRPTKYVVLRDDNNMTADEIQKMCYYLCFISSRSTKSISIPTPVSNAHLAAFRAKVHILAKNIRTGGRDWNQTKEQREEREAQIAEELNQKIMVKESLKNKLYYC